MELEVKLDGEHCEILERCTEIEGVSAEEIVKKAIRFMYERFKNGEEI